MKSHKVSQAELETRIGCSESMLSRFISGRTDKLGGESINADHLLIDNQTMQFLRRNKSDTVFTRR
ncbi:MAG: helix-turn-helix transcriptional regulator [Eubacteriales bacterium]|nr:helix-turn-helix transcriptional regulator [Eubacteriales bacterium]